MRWRFSPDWQGGDHQEGAEKAVPPLFILKRFYCEKLGKSGCYYEVNRRDKEEGIGYGS